MGWTSVRDSIQSCERKSSSSRHQGENGDRWEVWGSKQKGKRLKETHRTLYQAIMVPAFFKVSITGMKHHDQKQFGEERFIWLTHHSLLREVKAETQTGKESGSRH